MKRDYTTGTSENVRIFTGIEVEHTPAFGKPTLFVVGLQPPELILSYLSDKDVDHIFFGANHSFNPSGIEDWVEWELFIREFLEKGLLCSLDIPISHAEEFLESGLCEYENFIPQLRIPIPYIKQWNYNTMIKLDDKGYNISNPGVWAHSLHDLMDRSKFTSWDKYKKDEALNG